MLERLIDNPALRGAIDRLQAGQTVRVAGVWGAGAALVAASAARATGRTVVLITRHLDDADDAVDDVENLARMPASLLPAWEVDLGADHLNDEIAGERMRLAGLLAGAADSAGPRQAPAARPDGGAGLPQVIVAPAMAVLQPLPSRKTLAASRLTLERSASHDPDALSAWLVDHGYEQVEQVDQQGEFARRGGILDLFAPGATFAVRIEFFGDEIDSIRRFDLDTQRSIDELDGYDVTAAAAGLDVESDGALLSDYLPDDAIVCLHEPEELIDLAREMVHRAMDLHLAEGAILHDPQEVFDRLGRLARLDLSAFGGADDDGAIRLDMRSLQKVSLNTHEALTHLGELADAGNEVWVPCENEAEKQRFEQLIAQGHPKLAGRLKTTIGHVSSGFHWPGQRLVVAPHHEVFHRHTKLRRIRRVRAGRPIESMLDLNEGDYVVHVAHGIAKFQGLKQLARDGRQEEYLALQFADNAILHVPASKIDLVQKYIGSGRKRPNLSKLGGARWARQKEQAAEAVKDMAAEMLRIQAMRQAMQGIAYPVGTQWQRQFADEFVYNETEDQLTAIADIESDMAQPRPMDRLLCGDVGYGKTELAMRAAFRTAEAGKQVAVLVPTTVLASQHYQTFTQRFADYPFRIELLSRFRSSGEQAQVIKDLKAGQVDILIGTHRILSKDVQYADLGLAVIDEEQRFGVEHKDHLKSIRATVDVITMTATPIPRTMHMALLGLRDISALATPPMDRRSIHTEVRQYDDELIRKAIGRELNRQGQVFFVHNRVHDIEAITNHVRSLAPDARVIYAHGQMAEGQLEAAMLKFIGGEVDVLVCTTIIESGLDIPSANTMIIHEADRFGLAELHQLRGRVGRYKHRAYCYLLLPQRRTVSPEAAKRLKAIEEFSDLGAGFQIAMRDLEIRGAGNILGAEQSGHIAAVGYELYCQLLEQTVRQLKGQPAKVRRDVHLELGIDSYIPRSYIPVGRQRMEAYRRLVGCGSAAELSQLARDLDDAYGKVPPEVELLLDLAEIRLLAGQLGVDSIIRIDPDLVFTIREMQKARDLFTEAPGTVRLPDDHTVHWRLPGNYRQMPTMVTVLLKRLRQASRTV